MCTLSPVVISQLQELSAASLDQKQEVYDEPDIRSPRLIQQPLILFALYTHLQRPTCRNLNTTLPAWSLINAASRQGTG